MDPKIIFTVGRNIKYFYRGLNALGTLDLEKTFYAKPKNRGHSTTPQSISPDGQVKVIPLAKFDRKSARIIVKISRPSVL